MKKLIPFLLVLLILPSVFAVSVDLKEEYRPRETLIAKVTGNFLENLDKDNVFFYSGRQLVPMDYDVGKFGDNFYIYAVLPNKERNYTLRLKDIFYFEMGEDKTGDLEFNFSVSGSIANFTVNPGFVITSKDFNLDLESNVGPITLQVKYLDFSTEVEIPAGRTKSILVPLGFSEEIDFVEISSSGIDLDYEIPVNQVIKGTAAKSLIFSKTIYNLSLSKGSPYQLVLYLQNPGQEEISNIQIVSSSDDVVIVPESIASIKPAAFAELNVSMVPKDDLEFTIFANAEDISANTTIIINVLTVDVTTLIPDEIKQFSCPEIGEICTDSQECDGQEVATLETEHCCVGKCKSKFPTTIVIIILLIIGIGAIGYYLLKLKQGKLGKPVQKSVTPKHTEVRSSLSRT